jgi:integrase
MSPVNSKTGAERIEREIRNALADGTYGIVKNEDVPTVSEYEPDFLRWYATEGKKVKKPASIQRRVELLRDHIKPLFGNRRLNDFGEKQEEALKQRLAQRKSKSSYNCAAATINKMIQGAKKQKLFSSEPFQFSYFPKDEPRPKYYTREQLARLLAAAVKFGPLAECMVLLGADAGERRGEMLGCDGANANFDTGKLEVWEAEYIIAGKRNANTTKGGRMRTVKMTPRLQSALKRRIAQVGYGRLFVNKDGSQMTNWDMRCLMAGIQEAAGLKDSGDLHILRHTFGSHLALAGVPLTVIQKLMGHRNIQSTMAYMHLAPSDLDAGMTTLASFRRQPDGNETAAAAE